ncbi:MAG: MFS transporter [Planctomycetota bacterium]|nr:MAG: MFS transporter [Planctomycetota bacterium]
MQATSSGESATFDPSRLPTVFGHPTGLYTLFFAEMWERFSYYGMRALLVLYMIKGFLGYGDKDANAVYGAYTALVYMTPFFGGMIADRLLGRRTSVIIGGLLMAAGHLMMTLENDLAFFSALGLLIAGNGFFKPNISSMVGEMYPEGSPKRDGGFTVFYIGINLGAAMAPLLCGYIGETWGWHYGFGLATVGMLVGVAIFAAPTVLTQAMILATALASAAMMLMYNAGDLFSILFNYFVVGALVLSATAALVALSRGGLPTELGRAPDPEKFSSNLIKVLVGTAAVIPIFVILVSGFSVLPGFDEQVTLIPEAMISHLHESQNKLVRGIAQFVEEASRPAGLVLILAGIGATVYLFKEAFSLDKIARERMFVVFVLTFFSIWFWAFFEQQGSSINNFTDRNVDRVSERSVVDESMVGTTEVLRLTSDDSLKDLAYLSQEYLGHENAAPSFPDKVEKAIRGVEASKEAGKQLSPERLDQVVQDVRQQPKLTMSALTYLREFAKSAQATEEDKKVEWTYTAENVGRLGIGGSEIPASVFQSVNPIYIMLFGLLLTALWDYLGARGMEPSTPFKFSLGLLQVGLGFSMLYFGTQFADEDGMVNPFWLLMMYLLLTTGELCLSPVGLSMVTKLSPHRLVSTVMGSWFLATAFAQFLAAIIAQFAAVNEGGSNFVPIPAETVHIYGEVYKTVAVMAGACGGVCLLLTPLLRRWMHTEVQGTPE